MCKNLHVLLTGKAREWYWRYRKENPEVEWENFCMSIKTQYHDFKDDDTLMEEIRARKQREGESFESFYEGIMKIFSRLSIPLDEHRLTQQLIRNLLPDLRQALLYVQVSSIAHLRQLVYKRDNLLGDTDFKRLSKTTTVPKFVKRSVAMVEAEESSPTESETEDASVDAVQLTKKSFICWNCNKPGHAWDMCLAERCVFCYGCGAKNIYNPTCLKRAENSKAGTFVDSRRRAH